MKKLLEKTHEAWLATLMTAFMAKNAKSKQTLFEFSDIMFRHFTWIEHDLIVRGMDYDYDRDHIPIKVERLKTMTDNLLSRISDLELLTIECEDENLRHRIESDLSYISKVIASIPDESVEAFDMNRKYGDVELSREATDALTLFLFEESYKEYELIMIYNYLKAHSDDEFINRIFQIMVDESFFHLRSFCQMMSDMGILGVPRVIHRSLYSVEDMESFLRDGIEEETAAKEQCRELSDAVAADSEELASFFDFINYQESYHIDLMKEALEYYTSSKSDK
jgi:rubrerythrin